MKEIKVFKNGTKESSIFIIDHDKKIGWYTDLTDSEHTDGYYSAYIMFNDKQTLIRWIE